MKNKLSTRSFTNRNPQPSQVSGRPKQNRFKAMADDAASNSTNLHIVLVHGACHGAWSWHKLTTLLRSAGHRVAALDLAASGIDERRFVDIRSFTDYNRPLLDFLESLPSGERAVLVGHSLGGINISFAMDKFPAKVAVGVFITAFMPDSDHPPVFIVFKHNLDDPSNPFWLDTQFGSVRNEENGPVSMLFGPNMMANFYDHSPVQDLTLAMTLLRPISMFADELLASPPLSKSGYASTAKVYIKCEKDIGLLATYQQWMIENNPVNEVKVIEEADHMPMLSTPEELSRIISEIVKTYA
ncbi:hypothetical protein ZIOFF_057665 [Zingiber officinale]|uniref:AB hydrolase-1 domain-containing protein n=1 Tax=Zingiber officinale TaxID=94328 RepID=A0A8J5KH30_ZINOF|nr:hypothetical protein ZIOFF_057661 [Zingiber officinale]KAG6481073.1 hypothetical protein ZIOFF_057665 [Zingiber officinale]